MHAYCLMRNHFHLVVETPNANLVAGTRWLLSGYTNRFNHRHKRHGHVLSGRYKALVVDGSGHGCLRTAGDDGHLNPVRAKLLRPKQRLRRETTLTIIAGRLHLGSWKSFNTKLHRWRKTYEKDAK